MFSRVLLCAMTGALATGAAACGITSRHTVGPTLDSNGHFGLLFAGTIGPVVGCARKVAVPARLAAGLTTVDTPGGVEDDAVRAFDVGVGVDWILSSPRHGGPFDPALDLSEEDARGGWRLGKRLGVRTGYLSAGEVEAWTVGVSGTVLLPLRRNMFSLGLEAGCDALVSTSGQDAPWFRCDLGLAFDLTNLAAVIGPVL